MAMIFGKVKVIFKEKGFGFINGVGGSFEPIPDAKTGAPADIFFHIKDCRDNSFDEMEKGVEVVFDSIEDCYMKNKQTGARERKGYIAKGLRLVA